MDIRIQAEDYGIRPGDHLLNTYHLMHLLDEIREDQNLILCFRAETYHFYPDYALERNLYISNHDNDGPRRVIFDLSGLENFTLDGGGATFLFHAQCLPFYLHETKHITLRNFTLDYVRPNHTEAEITEVTESEMSLRIDQERYPYTVKNGVITFPYDDKTYPLSHMLEFDRDTYGPIVGGNDYWFASPWNPDDLTVTETESGLITITLKNGLSFYESSRAGNIMCLRYAPRNNPGIYATYSQNLALEGVTVLTSTGMAFLAEHSGDLTLHEFDVRLGEGRYVSSGADATHFVYCYGSIELDHCHFENQLDDAANIHGIYGKVRGFLDDDTTMVVELVHHQQKGVPLFHVGDTLSLLDGVRMTRIDESRVVSTEFLNGDFQLVTTEHSLKSNVGDDVHRVVENRSYVPDVSIHDCTFINNRARSLLITTPGKVFIERNTFSVRGAAILLEGDATHWFESGATKDVVIRDNLFTDCSDGAAWGRAVIQSSPGVDAQYPEVVFHEKLTVTGNTFRRCGKTFDLRNVGTLIDEDNHYELE